MFAPSHSTQIKSKLRDTSILVLGDLILDQYIEGHTNRISPEAPIPVVSVESSRYVLGGAGNVVNNLKALQAKVFVIGVVGKDNAGKILKKLIADIGVNNKKIIEDGARPTTLKTRVLCAQQQMIRLDNEITTTVNESIQLKICQSVASILSKNKINAIIVSDYAKGCLCKKVLAKVFALAKHRKIPVIVDPKSHDFSIYHGATYIKPNIKETMHALQLQTLSGFDEKAI